MCMLMFQERKLFNFFLSWIYFLRHVTLNLNICRVQYRIGMLNTKPSHFLLFMCSSLVICNFKLDILKVKNRPMLDKVYLNLHCTLYTVQCTITF
jgi:hypothetical protein